MSKPNYELEKMQLDFKAFYDANLQHKYEQFEPVRQKYLKQFYICVLFVALLILPCFLCGSWLFGHKIFMTYYTAIVFFAVLCCVIPPYRYRLKTKSLIITKILSFWGTFRNNFSSAIKDKDLRESELFADFGEVDTDDSFKGKYNNTTICFAEKKLKGAAAFTGIIILLEFNKKFKGKTVVHNSDRITAMLRRFRQKVGSMRITIFRVVLSFFIFQLVSVIVSIWSFALSCFLMVLFVATVIFFAFCQSEYLRKRTATQRVLLEEISFNKEWEVLTIDQIEARYLLTPVFMEKINNIKKMFHGKHIDFSFFDNKLMIAVHTRKDMFETTSLFAPALSYHKVREVVNQLYGIFAVIDIINDKKK